MKKHLFLLILGFTVSVLGCSMEGKGIKGSGIIKKEVRTAPPFKAVQVNGAYDVAIAFQKDQKLEVEADDNLLPLITTEVQGDTLIIKNKCSITTRHKMTITIGIPTLERLSTSGSSDVTMDRVPAQHLDVSLRGSGDVHVMGAMAMDDLSVRISGSGDAVLTSIKSNRVTLEASGSGDIRAEGETKNLSITLSGSSDVAAKNLHAENAQVTVYGSGDAQVTVTEKLDAAVSGSGDISYFGNPKTVQKGVSGSGSIETR